MKEIFRSTKTFTAIYTLKSTAQTILIMGLTYIALGAVFAFADIENGSFIDGFTSSFIPMLGTLIGIIGMVILNNVYSYNMPISPGYKYFHSIADSGKKFRQALIGSNILGIGIVLLGSALTVPVSIMMKDSCLTVFSLVLGVGSLGMSNIVGLIQKPLARILGIMPVAVFVGFVTGFTNGMEKDEEVFFSNIFIAVMAGVVAVIYILGWINLLLRAEKKWGEN